MTRQKKKHHSTKGLIVILTSLTFLTILISMLVTGLITIILYHYDLLPTLFKPSLLRFLLFIAFLSTIIGTTFAYFFGKFPLKPIDKLIQGTKELAAGNFDVRIDIDFPSELGQLSDSFNHMAKELSNLELLRNDFVNNFSHEFKTPIVSLCGFAKLLKNGNLSEEERNEYLDIIIYESERLTSLATNILFLNNIEKNEIPHDNTEFQLSEQIRHSILLLSPKWEKKNIQLSITLDETTYYGNEDLLSQIWINLLDNAIKFSQNDQKIQIQLLAFDDSIIFKIQDFGQGMNEETKSRMFDKFYQGDLSHTRPGNGLGLSIVKKIVDLHSGTITVRSQPNKGTLISVELPRHTK